MSDMNYVGFRCVGCGKVFIEKRRSDQELEAEFQKAFPGEQVGGLACTPCYLGHLVLRLQAAVNRLPSLALPTVGRLDDDAL